MKQQTPRLSFSYRKVNIHSRLQLYKSMSPACKVSKLSIVGGVKVSTRIIQVKYTASSINSSFNVMILDNRYNLNFG